MIRCPTDLKTIRRNILHGLSVIQLAVKIESGKACPLDVPGMNERYRGWDQALGEAYYDFLEPLPRKIRLALPFLYEQRPRLMTVLFKNNVAAGERLREPVAFSCVPTTDTHPREHGAEFRVGTQDSLHKCLANPLLKPTWPDIDSYIDEAMTVLDDFERSGVSEIVPTVEEIRGLIIEIVGEYQRPWPIRADEPDDSKHAVAKEIGNKRPWRGVPVNELRGRVLRVEPATRGEALSAAIQLMIESGELRVEHHEWTGHGGKTTRGECYILSGDAQPAGGDATPLAGEVKENADRHQPTLADIPRYDPKSEEWVSARYAAKREGLEVSTLKAYRKPPHCRCRAEDGSHGVDRDGRMWRRKDTTPHAHVVYYHPSLRNSSTK